jgi:hypothetical protein
MAEENIEAEEQAADIFWQMACADLRLFARGIPLADLLEEDDNG